MACRMKVSANWRLVATVVLIGLCSLLAIAIPSRQDEEEDGTRRIWNKRFQEARARAARRLGKLTNAPTSSQATSRDVGVSTVTAPTASPAGVVDGELIGVTVWRLRNTTASDDQNRPRLLVQKDGQVSQLIAARVAADTPFSEGQMVRLGIEATSERDSYLYVIDREVYADGTTSDPYLIFPSQTTPPGGNVVTDGKIVYVPAQGDPIPYFTLSPIRKDYVREALTIIVSPTPLDLTPGAPGDPTRLDSSQVAQWEKQWGGRTEQREARGGVGKQWTVAEKEAGEGERRLAQSDPLPQTIYRVEVKPGAPALVHVPLRIAK